MSVRLQDLLPPNLALSDDHLRFDLAVGLFVDDHVSLGQAARMAGMDSILFRKELASRKVPLHYGVSEFHEDLRTLGIPIRP